MPTIIITTDGVHEDASAITLAERLVPSETHSDHYLGQLIERVGWALVDAEEIERQARATSPPSRERQAGHLRAAA